MRADSRLLATYSPARALIYQELTNRPGVEWSIRRLANSPAIANLSRDVVRANLYILLADRIATLVPHHQALTLRLTPQGAATLGMILAKWRARGLRAKL